jgi:hypothetical protein
LLPLTGDRPPVAPEGSLGSLLGRARRAAESLEPGLFAGGRLYIAYSGRYYGPAAAWLLYWPLAQVTGTDAAIAAAEDLVYHLLAYREEKITVVAFIEPGTENMAIRLGDVTHFTGAKLVTVAPPLPPVIEDRYRGDELLVAEEALADTYILVAAALAARIIREKGGIELRAKRFRDELGGLEEVHQDLLNSYSGAIQRLGAAKIGYIASTPTMRSAAYMFRMYYEYRDRAVIPLGSPEEILSGLSHGVKPSKPLLLSTGVEQDLVREVVTRLKLLGGTEAEELKIQTDPLTAPIYGSLLALELARRLTK